MHLCSRARPTSSLRSDTDQKAPTMRHSYSDDFNLAFANCEATAAQLTERFKWTVGYIDRDTPASFDTLEDLRQHLANRVAPDIAHHRPGWTIDVFDSGAVCGPDGPLDAPTVAVHHAEDPDIHAAAITLPPNAYAVPHRHTIVEISNLGVDAYNALQRTEAAAVTWDLTARVARQIADLVDAGDAERDGADVLQAWVNLQDEGYYAGYDRLLVRYPPGGGTNLDDTEFAEHPPWQSFAIWDAGNATLHTAHSGPDPTRRDAEPDIVASIDDQSAIHHDSVGAVAEAAARTLRDQIPATTHPQPWIAVTNTVPVLHDTSGGALPLRCCITEPDASLIDAPLRPPRRVGLGLVADPSAPGGIGWAADTPTTARDCPDLAL